MHTPSGLFFAGNGTVDVGFRDALDLKNGIQVLGGQLDITQGIGSVLTLGGKTTIDGGGSLNDEAGNRPAGAGMVLNGTISVGSLGANNLGLCG